MSVLVCLRLCAFDLYANIPSDVWLKFRFSNCYRTGKLFSCTCQLIVQNGIVMTDSSAALGIPQRSGLGGRTRHVQVQYLWIKDSGVNKELDVRRVALDDNLADILT